MNRPLASHSDRLQADAPLAARPVFVVGAPRSGTTLLYQLLVHAMPAGYLSNLHSAWYGKPHLIEQAVDIRRWLSSDYQSVHGRTRGLAGPSEATSFWRRFLPPVRNALEGHDAHATRHTMRAAIAALQAARDRPFVFKHPICSFYMQGIADAVPEARFVHIARAPADNAASIYMSNIARYGAYRDRIALDLLGPPAQRFTPAQQVVGIVATAEQAIAEATVDADTVLHTSYEELCLQPARVVASVAAMAAWQATPRHVPGSFPLRGMRGPPDMQASISHAAAEAMAPDGRDRTSAARPGRRDRGIVVRPPRLA